MHTRTWTVRAAVAVAAAAMSAALFGGCSGSSGGTTDSGTDGTTNACGNAGTLCSGSCVNTQSDNANCGTCGTACSDGEVCSQGKCAASCGGGTKLCGSTCADTKNDPQNCGGCGTKCGSGEVCSNSSCGNTCGTGQTFCGGDSGTPYCANTHTDNANCGGCGITCGTGQVCANGTCSSSCGGDDAGTDTLCTPDGGLAYCANTKSDNQNCGGCGIACGNGETCQNGACTNACVSQDGGTQTLCTPDAGPTYCADLANDPLNCGTCGNVCTYDACQAGKCVTRTTIVSNYATFVTVTTLFNQPNVLYPGDTITETNNWGGFFFQLGGAVTSVDITITGAGGALAGNNGGSGGTGKVTFTPAFLSGQNQTGFWVILGQVGLASAGGSGGTTAYRAFNGGGAATDWSSGQGTYTYAGGGGGGSDLRFTYNGSTSNPQTGDPTASFSSRFAAVGGGGGGTLNTNCLGGAGGGFNLNGGDAVLLDGTWQGHGATTTSGGAINGGLGLGGDGLQDDTEGWAGGGGGGYYGGGAPTAHAGGGGGSGYLLSATGLTQDSTSSGTQGGNANHTQNGAFVIVVH